MKTVLPLVCFLLVLFGCEKAEIGTGTDCTDYLTNRLLAENQIRGEWQLARVSSIAPNPTVPDVRLVIDRNRITVWENGTQTNRFRYLIVKNRSKELLLWTDAQPQNTAWHLHNARLLLCKNRLFLDDGIALDGPGYDFHRTR
ncbi:hypothetical protein [Larkinella rosea]|uniref:Lipocalin-like domain-containing protein n=1 Tax=Larkinella rosea TaxID=2025312 RepID=A0A3P1BZB9_9BACT|nr:hypothetical protein [Larkinella rosea]RRB06318.1 hypothetical protein EHT25_00490 [Larkinella rosea]